MTSVALYSVRTVPTAPPGKGRGRTLASYLLMPRPKDLVKGLLIPTTYALGVLAGGHVSGASLIRALVVLAAVELLVYPARYQWNDVRGFVADQHHPGGDRGRLPGPLSRARPHVVASSAVAGARLMVTLVLMVAVPEAAGVLIFAMLGVFGVAVLYEVLRSVGTGRTGRIPAPLTAGVVALWIVVGAGYVVRGLTGLALAIDVTDRPALLAAAVLTLWAYGVAFVTSRWALEATAFAECDDGTVRWAAHSQNAKEHQLALVRWLPSRLSGCQTVGEWAPLAGRTPLTAPWNVAMLLAGVAAAVTGRLLCGPCPATQAAVVAVVGGTMTALALVAVRWRGAVSTAGVAVLLVAMVLIESPRPVVAVLPWALVMAAYLFFSTRTMIKLGSQSPVAATASAVVTAVGRVVVGRPTWDAMHDESNGRV